ncbi:hypothetical protein MTR67_049310 [Solanum verrucosum]|uniref:Uncharacterized protein n=1 Tax=Solanum verrucosum TaxID=315347 RepID=A0AAF1A0F7_SOLVR|nr:hypothetical protein MTR67_049310 [Solanum verrucosum]
MDLIGITCLNIEKQVRIIME